MDAFLTMNEQRKRNDFTNDRWLGFFTFSLLLFFDRSMILHEELRASKQAGKNKMNEWGFCKTT